MCDQLLMKKVFDIVIVSSVLAQTIPLACSEPEHHTLYKGPTCTQYEDSCLCTCAPGSLLRFWRYIYHLLTYLLTYLLTACTEKSL